MQKIYIYILQFSLNIKKIVSILIKMSTSIIIPTGLSINYHEKYSRKCIAVKKIIELLTQIILLLSNSYLILACLSINGSK